jgi:hypothetical protein
VHCFTTQVNYFIEHLEEKDTLPPKGYEGQPGPAEAAAAAEKAKAKMAAAAVAAAAKRAAAAAPLPKPPGRVIVVGAGPAGLAAATVLKVMITAVLGVPAPTACLQMLSDNSACCGQETRC